MTYIQQRQAAGSHLLCIAKEYDLKCDLKYYYNAREIIESALTYVQNTDPNMSTSLLVSYLQHMAQVIVPHLQEKNMDTDAFNQIILHVLGHILADVDNLSYPPSYLRSQRDIVLLKFMY